jgi:hypothetical protein
MWRSSEYVLAHASRSKSLKGLNFSEFKADIFRSYTAFHAIGLARKTI